MDRPFLFVAADSSLHLSACSTAPILSQHDTIVDSEGSVSIHNLSIQFPINTGGEFSIRTLVSRANNTNSTHGCDASVVLEKSIFEGLVIVASGDTFVSGGVHDEQKVKEMRVSEPDTLS